MAKEKENVAQVTNEDNIQEVLENAMIVTDEIAKAAAEKIAARRKEKVTNELIEVVQKMEYIKNATLLKLRRQRRIERECKQYLAKLTELSEEIKTGKKAVSNWDKESEEAKKKYDQAVRDINEDIDNSFDKLSELYPNAWAWNYVKLIPKG